MHFSLVNALPGGAGSTHRFDDAMQGLRYAFARLGYSVETRRSSINTGSVNIVFGSREASPALLDALPANSIIFAMEWPDASGTWPDDGYAALLRRFSVWDYSRRRIRFLREHVGAASAVEMRLGYVPEMTRLHEGFVQDRDVLLVGATQTERCRVLMEALAAEGVAVSCLEEACGTEKEYAVARSKLVLSMQSHVPPSLELERLGYLWANRKAVVAETSDDAELHDGLEDSCLFRPYEGLSRAVCALLHSDTERKEQGLRGFSAFSRLRQEDFLEAVIGKRVHGGGRAGQRRPWHLHAGSGKDFRPECLNVDIQASMNPDLVLDLALPLDAEARYSTLRFGDISLAAGSFSRITAFEVLEHVSDLPQTMGNFLTLLCDGGTLELSVPYELSLGAWQDPTHVRAFNENSWLYYTHWAGYLGWRDERFELVSLECGASVYGRSLLEKGLGMDEVMKIPRAVDSMQVVLRKRRSSDGEKKEHDLQARCFYQGAVGEWEVHDSAR